MADQQAIEEANQGYKQQAELERLAALAKAKNQEYQTRQSKHDLRTALDAVVSQDLQNDYLTQRAVELNPNMGKEQGTMTDETQAVQETSDLEALRAEDARLMAEGAPLSERKAANKALNDALVVEQREIAATRTAAAQVQKEAQDALKLEAMAEREEELGGKQARKKAFYEKAAPQKAWYE